MPPNSAITSVALKTTPSIVNVAPDGLAEGFGEGAGDAAGALACASAAAARAESPAARYPVAAC